MKKRIILFFVFILLTLLASALLFINQDKKDEERKELCEVNEGNYILDIGSCNFLFGDKYYNYIINLENKCFYCTREECLYDNILETKGVLCK